MKRTFLAAAFAGLALVAGATHAQSFSFAVGSGSGTAQVGDVLMSDLHTRINSEKNAPAGTKYLTLKLMRSGKQVWGGLAQLPPSAVAHWEKRGAKSTFPITKVDNPLPVRTYDNLSVKEANGRLDIEVIQGNAKKKLGTMSLHYSGAK